MEVGLAIFGGVAAGCTLTAEIMRLTRSLRKMIKSIKYARRDISNIVNEINIFAEFFEHFRYSCSNSPASNARNSFSLESLITWTRSAIHGLGELLKNISALSTDDNHSLVKTVHAHLKWYFNKSAVCCFRASLRVARESMNGFMNIRAIEKLDEQLQFLKQTLGQEERQAIEEKIGQSVDNYIKDLKMSIQTRHTMRREIDKRLKEAKKEVVLREQKCQDHSFVPKVDELLGFAESVEQYVEDVVPQTRVGNRNSNQRKRSDYKPRKVESKRVSHSTVTPSTVSKWNKANPEPARYSPKTQPVPGLLLKNLDAMNKSPPTSITSPPSMNSVTWLGQGFNASSTPSSSTSSSSTFASDKATVSDSRKADVQRNPSYRSGRGKEYMNDPAGNILSPPRVKDRNPSPNKENIDHGPEKERRRHESNVKGLGEGLLKPLAMFQDSSDSTVGDGRDDNPAISESDGSDTAEEEENESIGSVAGEEEYIDEGPSPFRPVAGVRGRFPPGWHQKRKRGNSPHEFW